MFGNLCRCHHTMALVYVLLCATTMVMVSCDSDELRVQINLKKPLHTVAEEFVSFTIGATDLRQLEDEAREQFAVVASSLSPAYVKVKREGDEATVSLIGGAQWLNSLGFIPVLNMPHRSTEWSSRTAVRQLGAFYRSGVAKCVWQLGNELSGSDPISYVDDLATLREISEAFGKSAWGVIGADVSAANSPDEAQFYVELSQNFVDATGWIRSSASSANALMEKPKLGEDPTSIHSLEFTSRPLWLNFPTPRHSTTKQTLQEKENAALVWAAQLGTGALNGFSVIFQQLSIPELAAPSFGVYVSMLHKSLMDRKVFETEIVGGNISDQVYVFTHCSRNISGAFTVMGVNLGDAVQKVSSKLPTATTGTTVEQYILSLSRSGEVQLNGKNLDWDMPIIPLARTKKPNRLTTFTMPGRSVAFWVFSGANIKECRSSTAFNEPEPMVIRTKTGSEQLLQKLLLESVANPTVRRKRDLELIKSLDTIEKMFPDKPKLDHIQQELLNKMAALINDLQSLTNNITAPNTVAPLQEELKKIEVFTKNTDPFPIKVSNIYEPQQREQMRQKCKIIAHTLEKQCLRDLDPNVNMLPMRGLHMKRMRRDIIKPQVVRQFDDSETEDIRTNMIIKENDKPIDSLAKLFSALYSPKKEPSIPIELVGAAPSTSTTPLPTPFPSTDSDQQLQVIRNPYNSPELLQTFTKVAVRVIDLFTRHITRFWTAMTDVDD